MELHVRLLFLASLLFLTFNLWPNLFPLVMIVLLLTCTFEFRQADILIHASLFVMIQSFVSAEQAITCLVLLVVFNALLTV